MPIVPEDTAVKEEANVPVVRVNLLCSVHLLRQVVDVAVETDVALKDPFLLESPATELSGEEPDPSPDAADKEEEEESTDLDESAEEKDEQTESQSVRKYQLRRCPKPPVRLMSVVPGGLGSSSLKGGNEVTD